MKSLFSSLLSYFLTPGGLVLMGALDSSLVFFLPHPTRSCIFV